MSSLPEASLSLRPLTKKEKSRLEEANKKAFEEIVEHFGKKSDAYLTSYMPEKIVVLTKILEDLGDLKTALTTVINAVKLPPPPPSSTTTTITTCLPLAVPSSSSTSSSSAKRPKPSSPNDEVEAAVDELPKSKKRKIATNGTTADTTPTSSSSPSSAMTDDDAKASAVVAVAATQSSVVLTVYPCEVETYLRKSARTDKELARLRQHVPCNGALIPMLGRIKTEALEFVEMVGLLKIWIQLNIPRIEDGNNFGVGVQEEIVGELASTEDASFAIIEHTTKYFVSRGKLASKVLKWPELLDYRNSVKELDEKEMIQLRLDCIDLRNHYLTLYDLMQKNMDKLKKPRSSLAYRSMF